MPVKTTTQVMGKNKVLTALVKLQKKYKDKPEVVVGFSQSYSVYVHENLQAKHKIGEAKFLENAVKAKGKQVGLMITKLVKQGMKLLEAALLGGLVIQADAQKRCPVDTGALRASAFTSELSKAAKAAMKAFKESQKYKK